MKRMLISFLKVITSKTQVKIQRREQLSKMCSGSVDARRAFNVNVQFKISRFDSEMTEDDVGEEKPASETLGDKKVSVEDLNDALIDDTEDSEGEGVTIRRRKEASDTDQEDFKECKAASSSCLSSSCADTTDASESSVTNSPNPRQTQKKGKKGKKKKR